MKKILIVDDMREVYDKLKRKFKDSDYASNSADALTKIKQRNYSKVITDYHLGEKEPEGGLKVLEEASKRGIESILMSTENHEEEALKYGFKFIFKKELIEKWKRKN